MILSTYRGLKIIVTFFVCGWYTAILSKAKMFRDYKPQNILVARDVADF